MSTKTPATVRALFDDLNPRSSRLEYVEQAALAKALKAVTAVEWGIASSSLVPKLAELLDIKLSSILVSFWEKADEVTQALRESENDPERSIEVTLYDCTTEATLSPYIEVRLGPKGPGKRIPVAVVLPMTFKAVVLTIKGGKLAEATGGECEINGSVTLLELTLAKLKKPIRITLGSGLVGGASRTARSH